MSYNYKKGPVTPATDPLNVPNNYNVTKQQNQGVFDIPMPDPWPEPVNGAELITNLREVFTRHLSLSDGVAEMLPYWVLHTYKPELFYFTPRLCIYSPVPRCGKSQLLQLLEMTTFRPLNISSITSAGIFRVIDAFHPTMLIDEADTYMNGNSEMRGIINSGFMQGGTIVRNVEIRGQYIPKRFNCFAPMAIAGIGLREDTIMDRSIVVIMRRRKLNEYIEKLRPGDLKLHTEQLRAKCMRFMNDNADTIAQMRPKMPQFLNDRAADIWEPLFCIALAISPECTLELTDATVCLASRADDEDAENLSFQLLADIRQIFAEQGDDFIATETLLQHLYQLRNRQWGEKQYGQRMLNSIKLASMLRDFQIRPIQARHGEGVFRGYKLAAFSDAFDRYLPPLESRDSVTNTSTLSTDCNNVTDYNQYVSQTVLVPSTITVQLPAPGCQEWQDQLEQSRLDYGDDCCTSTVPD